MQIAGSYSLCWLLLSNWLSLILRPFDRHWRRRDWLCGWRNWSNLGNRFLDLLLWCCHRSSSNWLWCYWCRCLRGISSNNLWLSNLGNRDTSI